MLRSNLATRPFYNERAVHIVLGLAAIVVLVLTAFNAVKIISLSRQNTEFSTRINDARSEARRLTTEAEKIRAGINREELQATASAATEANRLIEQRTFSWTAFFNRIEETLPGDVMLTAVQPSFEHDVPAVLMTVLGRRTEDIDDFIGKLEATGAFSDVLPRQSDPTDEGLQRVQLRAIYTGAAAPPEPDPQKPVDKPVPPAPAPGGSAKPAPSSPAGPAGRAGAVR